MDHKFPSESEVRESLMIHPLSLHQVITLLSTQLILSAV